MTCVESGETKSIYHKSFAKYTTSLRRSESAFKGFCIGVFTISTVTSWELQWLIVRRKRSHLKSMYQNFEFAPINLHKPIYSQGKIMTKRTEKDYHKNSWDNHICSKCLIYLSLTTRNTFFLFIKYKFNNFTIFRRRNRIFAIRF